MKTEMFEPVRRRIRSKLSDRMLPSCIDTEQIISPKVKQEF